MEYTKEQLQSILDEHIKWLKNEGGARADLRRANLRGANLREADLCGADLRGADLCVADLRRADLCGADLRRADLREADLREADLRRADLCGADGVYIPLACPTDGAFIGWKKAELFGTTALVKLQIPEDAKRLSATTNKCRCDKAIVLDIIKLDNADGTMKETDEHLPEVYSTYDHDFCYKIGETVTPRMPFDEDRWEECSSGIHFFINKQEAMNY